MDKRGLPQTPLEAASHANPYAYYRMLAARGDLYRDAAANMWMATKWPSMEAVLASPLCHTRPLAEPVPATIANGKAGDIFRHLVRMIDGPAHCPLKSMVAENLSQVTADRLAGTIDDALGALDDPRASAMSGEALTRFIYAAPVQIVARLLGVSAPDLSQVTQWVDRLAFAFTPVAGPADIDAGHAAAGKLLDLFGHLAGDANKGLLAFLAAAARRAGRTDMEPIIANGIGFLTQTYEATAALIANTLIALARHEESRAAVLAKPELAHEAVLETLRYDPPAQNTRRFVAADGVVAGAPMRQGDAILILLGAPGRDPAINSDPDRFDLFRKDRRIVNFGSGAHACPGGDIATTIAARTVRYLLSRVDFAQLTERLAYRRSVSVRAPMFGT